MDVGIDDGLQVAVEHGVKVVSLVIRAMVDDTVFREVVCADSLGAIKRTYLRVTHVGGLGGLLLMLHGQQAGLQYAQRGGTVLNLRLLILHVHRDSGWQVGHAHGGIRGVHGLAAGAGAHEDVDFQVFRIDLDLVVILVGLGEHDDAGSGSLDTALRFGDGDALHTVYAALVLHRSPHAVFGSGRALGADGDLHVLDAAELGGVLGLHVHAPATLLGVTGVHAQQVAGEQCGFLAAGAGLDLHDGVARIIRVTRDQRGAQLLLDTGQFVFKTLGFLGEVGVLAGHLLSGCQIVLHLQPGFVGTHDGTQFGVTTTQLAQLVRVGHDFGACHLLFDGLVLLKRGCRRRELFVCHNTLSSVWCCSVRLFDCAGQCCNKTCQRIQKTPVLDRVCRSMPNRIGLA